MLVTGRLQKSWRWLVCSAIGAILLGLGILIYETLPPRTVVMATGPEGGANYELGLRYREVLAKEGVTLKLVPTNGGMQNLARLRNPGSGVDVGFVQGGTTTKKETPNVESLGTIFYEPLWLFFRSGLGNNLEALRGRRVSIGPQGSAGRELGLTLIKRAKVDTIVGELLDLPPLVAADKLLADEIDAAFIVTGWESPVVQRLVNSGTIELASFQRANAFAALYPFLDKLILPAGVVDLLGNRPPADVLLLAPKASLAVRTGLHPAVQHLLLSAAVQIHSQPGIFQKAGQFPAAESIDLPLSEEAQRFYKGGRPIFEEHLPFWIATLVERIVIVFLPIAILVYPILKFLPKSYDWLMQSKIMRLYDEMRLIENEVARGTEDDITSLSAKLDHLDKRASSLRLPNNYSGMIYTLRSHLNIVRASLAANRKRSSSDGG